MESTAKFIERFRYMEKASVERGLDLGRMSLEEMDKLWMEAKNIRFNAYVYDFKEDL